jgi:hypothetical protein
MADDNSSLIYQQSRQAEAEAEEEALREQQMAEYRRSLLAEVTASPAPAAPEAPQQGAEAVPAEEEGPGILGTAADMATSLGRGVLKEGADILDNFQDLTDSAFEAIGIERDLSQKSIRASINADPTLTEDEKAQRIAAVDGGLKAKAEAHLGEAETTAGEITEAIGGQLAYVIPAMKAVKVAGPVTKGLKFFGAPAVVAGATTGEGEGNLGNLAEDLFGENLYSDLMAVDADDSTVERFTKTALEDVALGSVVEVGGVVAKALFGSGKKIVTAARGSRNIKNTAAEKGIPTDPVLDEAADKVVNARAKKEILEGAADAIDEGSEQAAFKGDGPVKPAELEQVEGTVREQADQAARDLEAAEAELATAAANSGADGSYMEAMRQTLADGGLGKTADEALGTAATRNVAPSAAVAPTKTVVGNFLEVTTDQANRVVALSQAEDIDDVIAFMGDTVYDSTNYERIAETGDITALLKANAQILGNVDESRRLLTTRGLAETEGMAQLEVARLARETGSSPEKIIAALDESLPGANLDVQLNALRTTELGLARKVQNLAAKQGEASWSDNDRAELVRWVTLLANVSDRRAGIVSELGRALSSLRLTATGEGFDGILDAARDIRSQQIDGILQGRGGADQVDKLASMLAASADDPDLLAKVAKASVDPSVADLAHHVFVSNALSGPPTQALNFASNTMRGAVWDPTMEFFSATARAVAKQNVEEFKPWINYMRGMLEGARGGIRLNGRISEGRVAQAFMRGRATTADSAFGKFADDISANAISAENIGKAVRKLPGAGTVGRAARAVGNAALFPLPQGGRDAVRNFVNARATQGARAVDYLGRVFEWPFKGLAAGDELAKGITKHARLHSEAYQDGLRQGLSGAELELHADALIRDTNNIHQLMQTVDVNDLDQVQRLNHLNRLDKVANESAQRSTYTMPPGKVTGTILQMKRNLPVARWFLPFINTPAQIAASGIRDFTVLGQAKQVFDAHKAGDPEKVAEAVGRTFAVAGVNFGMYQAIASGRVTGSGPLNHAEREIWLKTNAPNSIDLGPLGRVSYDRFDPLALPLSIMADTMSLAGRLGEDEADELIGEFWEIMVRAAESRTYLEGLSNMMNMVEDPERYGRRFVASTVGNIMVPQARFWASVNKGGLPVPEDLVAADPTDGGTTKLLKDFARGDKTRVQIQDEVPVLEGGMFLQIGSTVGASLPAGVDQAFLEFWQKVISRDIEISQTPQRDFFGDVRTHNPSMGPDVASPFLISPEGEMSPVARELDRMGYGISVNQRFGEISGVKLTPEQQDFYQREFAKPKGSDSIEDVLSRQMLDDNGELSSSWQELGDDVGATRGGKRKVVDRIVGIRMRAAAGKVRERYSDIDDQILRLREDAIEVNTAEGSDEVRQRRLSESPISALFQQ